MDIPPADLPEFRDRDGWHFDLKIPVFAVLCGTCALLVQAFAAVWFMSRMDSRLEDHDRRIVVLEHDSGTGEILSSTIAERLARIEGQLTMLVGQNIKEKP